MNKVLGNSALPNILAANDDVAGINEVIVPPVSDTKIIKDNSTNDDKGYRPSNTVNGVTVFCDDGYLSYDEVYARLRSKFVSDVSYVTVTKTEKFERQLGKIKAYFETYGENVWVLDEVRPPLPHMDKKNYYEAIALDHLDGCIENASWMLVLDSKMKKYLPSFIERLNQDREEGFKYDFPILFCS